MRIEKPLLVVLLTLAGCVQGGEPDDSATSGEVTSAAPTSGEPATTTPQPTTGEGTTGEVAGECSVWDQDCPAGAKCVPFDSMSTGVVDSARCVELVQSPRQSGDPCETEGGVVGLDDCDEGLLCWFLDADGEGVCTPMCAGSPDNQICGDGLVCDVTNGGFLPLCLATCDPLAPACPMGQICIPSGPNSTFLCDSDASGDAGAFGDPCEYINVCDVGLTCVAAANVPGCVSAGCCTEYCDVGQPADGQCSGAPEQECLGFFDDQTAPPGLEDVGFCGVMQ